jgi:type I site-specific restriction endonuclease
MTPEAKARQTIDARLISTGWVVQDMKQLNLGAARGVAVREYPTDTGPVDYVLFVDREPRGVIEAKKDAAGENLTAAEVQTERYANATLKWRKNGQPLRFLFKATHSNEPRSSPLTADSTSCIHTRLHPPLCCLRRARSTLPGWTSPARHSSQQDGR